MGILALALSDHPSPATAPLIAFKFDCSELKVQRNHLQRTTSAWVDTFETFCKTLQGKTRNEVMHALAGFQFKDDSSMKKPIGEIKVAIPVKENPPKELDMSTMAVEEREKVKIKKDPLGIVTFKQHIWN